MNICLPWLLPKQQLSTTSNTHVAISAVAQKFANESRLPRFRSMPYDVATQMALFALCCRWLNLICKENPQ